MPLIVEGRLGADSWRRLVDWPDAVEDLGHVIVPATALPAAMATTAWPRPLGVALETPPLVDGLLDWLPRLGLVEVGFADVGDGRGFSVGHALRCAGFAGELRARGPLMPDQAPQLVGCGFDSVDLPVGEGSRAAAWARAWRAFPQRYQFAPGSARLHSILAARHGAARAASD